MATFAELRNYYDKVDIQYSLNNENYVHTTKGLFVPSNLEVMHEAMRILFEKKRINTQGYFSDAGCGDGRVISLLSSEWNLPSIGTEGDLKKADDAEGHIMTLDSLRFFRTAPIVTRGDFASDHTYTACGVKFKDISTFFNYINNVGRLTEKIARDSIPGTVFVLLHYLKKPLGFKGLRLIDSILLEEYTNKCLGLDSTIPIMARFNVFMK